MSASSLREQWPLLSQREKDLLVLSGLGRSVWMTSWSGGTRALVSPDTASGLELLGWVRSDHGTADISSSFCDWRGISELSAEIQEPWEVGRSASGFRAQVGTESAAGDSPADALALAFVLSREARQCT